MKKARYIFVADRMGKEEVEELYTMLKNIDCTADNYSPEDRGEVYYDNDYFSCISTDDTESNRMVNR